ncbi:restriction endonuclease subunit S [bacterium]|nr:restriction endonuclease subunit S [bacterium]
MGVNVVKLEDIANVDYGTRVVKSKVEGDEYPVYGGGGETFRINKYNRENCVVVSRFAMSPKCTRYVNEKIFLNDSGLTVSTKDNSLLLQEYLDWYLLSKNDEIYSLGRGAGQRNLEIPSFKRMLISYPTDLEEQRKIIAQLKLADEIRQKKKLANEKLDEFLKSTFISMFGDPVRNEKNLKKVCIDYIKASEKNSIVDGPFGSSLKNEDYYESGIPIIRINNIRPCRFYNDEFKYIKESKYEQLIRSKVDYGDVLMARVGNTIGKSCLYDQHKKALLSTTGVCKITCDNTKIINKFLLLQMNMDTYREYIVRQVKGAGQPCLNLTTIKNFNIILPPIEQQRKYVQIVEQVEVQKQKNELVIEQMNNLFNSLSQRAFVCSKY